MIWFWIGPHSAYEKLLEQLGSRRLESQDIRRVKMREGLPRVAVSACLDLGEYYHRHWFTPAVFAPGGGDLFTAR